MLDNNFITKKQIILDNVCHQQSPSTYSEFVLCLFGTMEYIFPSGYFLSHALLISGRTLLLSNHFKSLKKLCYSNTLFLCHSHILHRQLVQMKQGSRWRPGKVDNSWLDGRSRATSIPSPSQRKKRSKKIFLLERGNIFICFL